jgi:hypothetical protein
VNGPSIAIEAVHDFELAPEELAAVVALLVVLLLLLPQPPATNAVRAKAATPMRTFTGSYSSS